MLIDFSYAFLFSSKITINQQGNEVLFLNFLLTSALTSKNPINFENMNGISEYLFYVSHSGDDFNRIVLKLDLDPETPSMFAAHKQKYYRFQGLSLTFHFLSLLFSILFSFYFLDVDISNIQDKTRQMRSRICDVVVKQLDLMSQERFDTEFLFAQRNLLKKINSEKSQASKRIQKQSKDKVHQNLLETENNQNFEEDNVENDKDDDEDDKYENEDFYKF